MSKFWNRAGYVPMYIRHPTSELTGERTCIMLRGLDSATDGELDWTAEFVKGDYLIHLILCLVDVGRRFLMLRCFYKDK